MTGRMGIMGSMPRLKIKDEIRYRKGSTNEAANCGWCKHFKQAVPDAPVHGRTFMSLPTVAVGTCGLIGRQNTVRYRVRSDYYCDRQEYDDDKTPPWMRRNR